MCPRCGSDECKSTWIDESPFRDAAASADMLRHFGDLATAGDVLTRLALVRVQNFLRLKWECCACGVQYDE